MADFRKPLVEVNVNKAAERIRDFIHETPMSLCNVGADTCPDWDLAYAITYIALDLPLKECEEREINRVKGSKDGGAR